MYSIEQRDDQLLGSEADIVYDLYFDRATQHLLRVLMTVKKVTGPITLCLPTWVPGSYKVREFGSNQGNLRITDETGNPLPWRWTSKNSLDVETVGTDSIRVEYVYYALERTVRTSHINRNHAFIMPGNCMMYVEGRSNEIHHLHLHHDRALWPQVSTALSPVESIENEDRPITVGALNYDILVDSPIEIGNHRVRSFRFGDTLNEVAFVGYGDFDADWICERIKTIVATEAALMNGLPYDRYVFILHFFPDSFGGLEHARSSVNAFDSNLAGDKDKMLRFLELLCHEFFHLWNVKRIRPFELGPFDYRAENYTRMLWLAEGLTSYYDDLLTYRCGFQSAEDYLQHFAKIHLWRVQQGQGRLQMSVEDSSYLAWIKLYYANGDSGNRFPSYYTKGGVIFFLLDLHIIKASNASKRLDDGLLALWRHYRRQPEQGITEEEFIAIVEEATGVSISSLLREWLSSNDELPYAEYLQPFGLNWSRKDDDTAPDFAEDIAGMPTPPKVSSGLALQSAQGKLTVSKVDDDSPAQRAGFGIDDEILSVNGTRVTSASQFDHLLRENGSTREAEIGASCDGQLYIAWLRPIEWIEMTITTDEQADDDQRRLRDFYLAR